MNPLRIVTLGNVQILRGDEVLFEDLSRRKAVAVLIYLVCEQREHPRDVLATLFWEDSDQSRALANLRVVLHYLKPFLRLTRQTVAFDADIPYWLDLDVLREGLQSRLHTELETALGLYQGEFMAGFHLDSQSFESWRQRRQTELEQLVTSGLLRVADIHAQQSRYQKAIDSLHRLLNIDPLNQAGNYALIRLLAASEQRNAAQHHLLDYEKQLKADLKTDLTPEFVALHEKLTSGEPILLIEADTPNNLHQPLTRFVPRAELTMVVERLLTAECRLLTLIGAGGIGKSRLALEAARRSLSTFPDGVYLVTLEAIEQNELLPLAIADAVGLALSGAERPLEQLITHFKEKRILLILDNFEQLTESATLVNDLLVAAPSIKMLATSREPLDLMGEWLLPIEGLSVPEHRSDKNYERFAAIQLFLQCAQRVQPKFRALPETIISICQLVEGMPLAIELAAGWLWRVDVTEILQALETDLSVLKTTAHNVPARHRSINAVFEHSWQLFDEHEQRVLSRLAVFRGSFTAEAAYEVAGADESMLDDFVRRSVLRGGQRYDMHGLLRQFLEDKLVDAFETYEKRFNYYLHWISVVQSEETGEASALERVEQDIDNLRATLDWAARHEQYDDVLSLANKLSFYWERRGNYAEGRYWFECALSKPGDIDPVERARGLYSAGIFAWGQSDFAALRQFGEQNLKLSYELENPELLIRALHQMGNIEMFDSNFEQARDYMLEALELARRIGDQRREMITLGGLGAIYLELKDYAGSIPYNEACLSFLRKSGNDHHLATALANLGFAHSHVKDYARAHEYLNEAYALYQKLKSPYGQALCLNFQGELAEFEGNKALAHQHHVASFRLYLQIDNIAGVAKQLVFIGALQPPESAVVLLTLAEKLYKDEMEEMLVSALKTAQDQISSDVYETRRAEGIAMSPEEALQYITLLPSP